MEFLKKHRLNIILIIILALFTYFAVAKRAAVNMDEFSQYHPIICNHYEFNKLNVFREACGMYDLVLPGTSTPLPLRSYGYGGSLASLYYYPLFLLWPAMESARMLGFGFILLQAWVLSRMLKQKFAYILIALVAFFPYLYQIIIDTGIVQFYTTAVLFACYFIERWFITRQSKYIIGTGVLLFLLVFSRLSFVFGFPALVIAFLAYAVRYFKYWKPYSRKLLKGALIALVVVAIPTALFFFSTSAEDPKLHPILDEAGRSSHTLAEMFKPSTYTQSELLRRFLSPIEATSRAYVMPRIGIVPLFYSAVLFLTPVALLLWQILRRKIKGNGRINLKTLLYYFVFLVTVLFLFRSTDTKHMHHAMMAYPFLILSWGYLLPDLKKLTGRFFKLVLAGLLVFNLYFFVTYTDNPIQVYDDPTLNEVNKILDNEYLAKNYFYIAPNWGVYFYQGLYGPKDQSVLYIENYTKEVAVMNALAQYPRLYGRKFLVAYNKTFPAINDVLKLDPTMVECSLTKDSQVWGIMLQTDNSPQNPCR